MRIAHMDEGRNCRYLDKQYMLGDSLLVAPIFNDQVRYAPAAFGDRNTMIICRCPFGCGKMQSFLWAWMHVMSIIALRKI